MKVLFIGGTGTISSAISKLAVQERWELFLLNRGNRKDGTGDIHNTHIECDIRIEEDAAVRGKLEKALGCNGQKYFDVVVDFIAFTADHVQKDFRIFEGLCKQYIFISSASAYQKPPASYLITESTPLANPFWQYSRDKIACENFLMEKYRECGFPVTIVRPSHTYDERSVPVGFHGSGGSWQILKRMLDGKPVIIHGDGTSLWTMTHNSDFARAFVRLCGNIHAVGEAVHITSDESLTWNQIYQIIAGALNVELKAVHIASDFLDSCSGGRFDVRGGLLGDKANSVVFDNTKLKRLAPGFCAAVRLDEGIKLTVANILKTPELQKEDPEFDAWCDRIITALETIRNGIAGW
ncbi:MAG: SDR family oxidoreductase [Treponema sp.]|jgi:nucleoside-diphosphate-sugar epimerase|nr:SDR family oxidoreductase [Treponema sp.]